MQIQKRQTAGARALERQAVQRMAARVQDETHWGQILASAETDAVRAELERVVGPLLAFRRAAPCTTPDCDSGKHGQWQPVLVVANPLEADTPSWVPIELRLCDDCKKDARLKDFLTDGIWAQVLKAWSADTLPPVRRLTRLQFDRIH